MNSWKRLSLSVTPGARKQMISAPNIDRLPFPKGSGVEGGCTEDAVTTRRAAATPLRQELYSVGCMHAPPSFAQVETMPRCHVTVRSVRLKKKSAYTHQMSFAQYETTGWGLALTHEAHQMSAAGPSKLSPGQHRSLCR